MRDAAAAVSLSRWCLPLPLPCCCLVSPGCRNILLSVSLCLSFSVRLRVSLSSLGVGICCSCLLLLQASCGSRVSLQQLVWRLSRGVSAQVLLCGYTVHEAAVLFVIAFYLITAVLLGLFAAAFFSAFRRQEAIVSRHQHLLSLSPLSLSPRPLLLGSVAVSCLSLCLRQKLCLPRTPSLALSLAVSRASLVLLYLSLCISLSLYLSLARSRYASVSPLSPFVSSLCPLQPPVGPSLNLLVLVSALSPHTEIDTERDRQTHRDRQTRRGSCIQPAAAFVSVPLRPPWPCICCL